MCIRLFIKKHLIFDDQQLFYPIPIVFGLLIRWKFGSIINAPATIYGFYYAAMGKMISAVLKNPALCKIPIQAGSLTELNMYSLAIFIACLLTLLCRIVRFSFRGKRWREEGNESNRRRRISNHWIYYVLFLMAKGN